MPSLRELQQRFADARARRRGGTAPAFDRRGAGARRRAHRHLPQRGARELPQRAGRDAIRWSRGSSATPFFNAAVDAFVARASVARAATSTSTATRSATFSRRIRTRRDLPYLARRRAPRMGDRRGAARGRRRRLAGARAGGAGARPRSAVAALRFALDPSCRLVRVGVSGAAHLAGEPGRIRGRRGREVRRGHRLRARDARRDGRGGAAGAGRRIRVACGARRGRRPRDGDRCRARGRRDVRPRDRAARAHRRRDVAAHRGSPRDRNRARRRPIRIPSRGACDVDVQPFPAGRGAGRPTPAAAQSIDQLQPLFALAIRLYVGACSCARGSSRSRTGT